MTVQNKFSKRAHISERKFKQLLKLFSEDLTATQISNILSINRNTVNRYLNLIRSRIAELCEQESPFSGEVEVDESFFGAKRKKGKRGRGAYGKTIVFGIYRRNGKVYTEIVKNCSRETLQAIIKGKVDKDSTIYSDKWRAYNGLVDLGYKKHYRLDHEKDKFVIGNSHINGIEGFWGFAKTRLAKFRGFNKKKFYLHLKETEFRYNYRDKGIYKLLLKIIKNKQLN
ncbi:IS1595 family transposase [Desulfobacterota bacterium AH_259_B03_O07]|nr:IS1595 family transposase [Desulfobacterota bacterium AH_259_B03_O07]